MVAYVITMKIALLIVASFFITCHASSKLHRIAEIVNGANASWKAGINDFHTDDYKKLVGTFHISEASFNSVQVTGGGDCDTNEADDEENMEEIFDARYHWLECPSISHIWNQGNCAADWAISAASVMNDRLCIATNGNITALYSPQKIVSCCTDCGNGCRGGYPEAALKYIKKRGIVTGGDYGSEEGCQPWLVPPCNVTGGYSDSTLGPRPWCGHQEPVTPKCDLSCYNSKYEKSFLDDIFKASKVYPLSGCVARKSLTKHGPYVVTMRVYEDFLTYKSGIYHHVTGDFLGILSARLIGWSMENGEAYWQLANSWGTSWGEGGFFRVKRAVNECWIENFRLTGDPKI